MAARPDRLLVTGATGFLGRSVIARLVQRHPEYRGRIRVLTRTRVAVPAAWGVETLEGDVRDARAVDAAVAACDIILHMAGLTHSGSSALYHAVNVEGTRVLIEAARRHGVRRIVFASSRAIDPAGGGYSVSKRAAEALIADAIKDFVIVRLAELYGEGDNRGIMGLILWMRRHRWVPVIGTGKYTVAPLHVDDAAAAMIGALQAGATGATYTVTGPENLTYNELVDEIAATLRIRCLKLPLPTWLARAGAGIAAACHVGVAYDQVDRLVSPRSDMDAATCEELGLHLRRFSEELPRLAARTVP
jgi:NADH dehydrogenase